MKWPFRKDEISILLVSIERQKSLFNLALNNDNLKLSMDIRSGVQSLSKGFSALQLEHSKQQKASYLSRLTSINFEAMHVDVASRRLEGTGAWLSETPEYTAWLQNQGTLWCHGIPGAGKTIIGSLIIENLREKASPEVGIAGLYCTYRSPQSIANLIGCLAKQLAATCTQLPESITDRKDFTLNDLRSILLELSRQHSKIMIVVDALDECENRSELLEELNRLRNDSQGLNWPTLLEL